MNCGNCANARPYGYETVYCRMFGIFIASAHEGCKYHVEDEGNGTTGKFEPETGVDG